VTLVTLDLRDLAFMDSSGLRLLIDLHDRSRREPWELTLMTPTHEAAAVVLRATGADKALPFEEDHAS
jgi:anti-anti-sigma factor